MANLPTPSTTPARSVPALALHGGLRLVGELGAVLFLGLIAAIASLPGASYVFFPELGALAHDVLTRPGGAWASAPRSLVVMPVVTAAIGVAFAIHMPFGFASVLIVVAICVTLLKILRSPLAPAISAGVLPLVFELKSWWYPTAILFGTGTLCILSWAWRKWSLPHLPIEAATHEEKVDDIMELAPRRWMWAPPFLVFLLIDISLVKLTGWRMILFPPIIVVAFEMFSHPTVCPWARRPLRMPVACFLSAAAGLAAVIYLGAGVVTTILSLAIAIVILRWLDLRCPPALAVSLIPQILPAPNWHYPFGVATGTTLLTGLFLLSRRMGLHSPASLAKARALAKAN